MSSNISVLETDPPPNIKRPTELEALRRLNMWCEPVTELDIMVWRCELRYIKSVKCNQIPMTQTAQHIVKQLQFVTVGQVLHILNRLSVKLLVDNEA